MSAFRDDYAKFDEPVYDAEELGEFIGTFPAFEELLIDAWQAHVPLALQDYFDVHAMALDLWNSGVVEYGDAELNLYWANAEQRAVYLGGAK